MTPKQVRRFYEIHYERARGRVGMCSGGHGEGRDLPGGGVVLGGGGGGGGGGWGGGGGGGGGWGGGGGGVCAQNRKDRGAVGGRAKKYALQFDKGGLPQF